ncbi:protein couch potato-like [Anopheles coustani]|uniref:protein couch potato-like n=1 Tax=Anopheles coustani TaxID=139045 RepID=UPI0026594DD6|nr:protein couch potato-like [Anopheles coustani]
MKMKLTNCTLPLLLLLLASSSCLADSQQQQQSVQSEQSFASAAGGGENSDKSIANTVDKNKRGAPSVPVVVGTPAAQHTAYINHHVVAAPISGHATHAAIGAVPFGYGHALASGGHILQTPAAAAVATAVPQHVTIHKVSYVEPARATTTTTTLKLASASEGLHHLSPLLAKYNYAVPQLTYTHYPQYQLVQHHHHQQQTSPVGGTLQPATIYATHTALHEHPVAEIATHHQPQHQQQTAYAHQQPIYASHPAAIHYSVALPGQHNYAGQQQQQQQQPQQQQQHPLSHTQAIHYQQQAVASGLAGQQPAVPIVHQAPIAAINQVHQAQQVYATQGQLTKYPLAGTSLYGAGGLQNQIYSTVPSYGDPDTLTNLANPEPSTPSDAPRRYPTVRPVSRPSNVPNDIRPITEYEDDYGGEGTDAAGVDNDLYRDEQPPGRNGAPAGGERVNEPCDKDSKKSGQPSAFNRNLYNMWRAYDLGRALLKASGASGTTPKPRTKPPNGDSTDRIQLIHPPGESDKKLKGKYYEGKYYAYNRAGRQETNRSPKSVNPGTTSTTTRTPSSRRRKLD